MEIPRTRMVRCTRNEEERSFDFRKCIIDPLQLFLSSTRQHGGSIWNGNGEGGRLMERRSSVPSVHYLNSSAPYPASMPVIESEWNRFLADTLAPYFISFYLCRVTKESPLQLTVEGKKCGGNEKVSFGGLCKSRVLDGSVSTNVVVRAMKVHLFSCSWMTFILMPQQNIRKCTRCFWLLVMAWQGMIKD